MYLCCLVEELNSETNKQIDQLRSLVEELDVLVRSRLEEKPNDKPFEGNKE